MHLKLATCVALIAFCALLAIPASLPAHSDSNNPTSDSKAATPSTISPTAVWGNNQESHGNFGWPSDDLIASQEREEVATSLGLGNDAAKPTRSCPKIVCSTDHSRGELCGAQLCDEHIFNVLAAYDFKYKRNCAYGNPCLEVK
jgi:hypothetical protein